MIEYRYDVQLLIEGANTDCGALGKRIAREAPGDSLLCVGDAQMMKVHYHTSQPWDVLRLCASTGEIYDIIVEDMVRQASGRQG